MGEKKEEDDLLTYEKLQHLIDKQLAHIDELQAEKDIKDIEKIINPTDDHLNKRSRIVIFYQSLKKLFSIVFRHKN